MVESTRIGLEAAGSCALRKATTGEIEASGLPGDEVFVVEDFRIEHTGSANMVAMPPDPGPGRISIHTHPGLHFGLSWFSEEDEHAVATLARPLMVIGYTALSPELMSTLAVPFGWAGIATAAGVHTALRMEANGVMEPRLLRRAVTARVLFPGMRVVGVRAAQAEPWRRNWEAATFAADGAVAKTERATRKALGTVWKQVKPKS